MDSEEEEGKRGETNYFWVVWHSLIQRVGSFFDALNYMRGSENVNSSLNHSEFLDTNWTVFLLCPAHLIAMVISFMVRARMDFKDNSSNQDN